MAMRYRERMRATIAGGTKTRKRRTTGVVTTSTGVSTSYIPGTCSDHLSPGFPRFVTDGDFNLVKSSVLPMTIDGTITGSGVYDIAWDGFVPNTKIMTGTPPPESMGPWITRAIERLNPNKPLVDIPANLLEVLFELPTMLTLLHREYPGIAAFYAKARERLSKGGPVRDYELRAATAAGAGGFLTYHFALKPMYMFIQDVLSLPDVMDQQLGRLQNGQRVGGRLHESRTSVTEVETYSISDLGMTTVTTTTEIHKEIWYTARFTAETPDLRRLTVAERTALRRAKSNGMHQMGLESFWEAVPFSWLIDYFTNASSVLTALRGWGTWSASAVNCMCHTTLTRRVPGFQHPVERTVYIKAGMVKHERKQREVGAFPTLGFNPVGLTSHQVHILTALALAIGLAKKTR